ncbi:hypothetical protein DFH29DRAFT_1002077 [Suillus ampliporus]|nr:hypothetical protein DFH29DRAFT_1002077 [Suillus ampliporus]
MSQLLYTYGSDRVLELSMVDRENVESMISDDIPYEPAPGDEGLDLSHKGGEYEAFEGLSHTMADLSGFHYVDPRT